MTPRIGQQIRELRERCCLTQNRLAKKVNITQHALSQIETGDREPNRRLLSALVDVLLSSRDVHEQELTPLIAALLEDAVPGARCYMPGEGAGISVVLSTGVGTTLKMKRNEVKLHTPAVQEVMARVIEDTELRDAFSSICHSAELTGLVKSLVNKSWLRQMACRLNQVKDNHLNLVEAILDNLPTSP